MNGKEFENVCLARLQKEEEVGRATMGRYGVQGSFQKGVPLDSMERWVDQLWANHASKDGVRRSVMELIEAAQKSVDTWRPLQSYPDFEGVLRGGRQFVFDAKVCNAASFPLDKEMQSVSRQLRHMLKRSRFGVICFYLIHFPERALATKTDPQQTWAFPVAAAHPFWESFERGEVKRISRLNCEDYGVLVAWNTSAGGRTERPDIVDAILRIAELGPRGIRPGRTTAEVVESAKPF